MNNPTLAGLTAMTLMILACVGHWIGSDDMAFFRVMTLAIFWAIIYIGHCIREHR